MDLSAGTILKHYLNLRQQIAGKPPPRRWYSRLWDDADAYLAWCEQKRVADPIGYLTFRCEKAKHSKYFPRLDRLASERMLELWNEWGAEKHEVACDVQAWTSTMLRKAGSAEKQQIQGLAILTVGQEALKRQTAGAGKHELCLAEISLSGGFHPDSEYCPTCPIAVECASTLIQQHGFDVVSLRHKRWWALPKHITSLAIG